LVFYMWLTLWHVLLLAIVLSTFSGTLYLALRITLYDNLVDILRSKANTSGAFWTPPGRWWNNPVCMT